MNTPLYLIEILIVCVLLFWLLYVFYIAVMAIRDRRNDGTLSVLDRVLGYPTLFFGLLVDAIVNTFMSVPLLELPHWHQGEFLLTPRMQRLARMDLSGAWPAWLLPVKWIYLYQRWLCRWLLGQIDQHDKSGGHDVPKDS